MNSAKAPHSSPIRTLCIFCIHSEQSFILLPFMFCSISYFILQWHISRVYDIKHQIVCGIMFWWKFIDFECIGCGTQKQIHWLGIYSLLPPLMVTGLSHHPSHKLSWMWTALPLPQTLADWPLCWNVGSPKWSCGGLFEIDTKHWQENINDTLLDFKHECSS